MDSRRNREIIELVNSLFFLMNRQNFHKRMIDIEEQRFHKSVNELATTHKKVEHVRNIRDYQQMMADNGRQIRVFHKKLKKYLELNSDLKDTKLYEQANEVLKVTLL